MEGTHGVKHLFSSLRRRLLRLNVVSRLKMDSFQKYKNFIKVCTNRAPKNELRAEIRVYETESDWNW